MSNPEQKGAKPPLQIDVSIFVPPSESKQLVFSGIRFLFIDIVEKIFFIFFSKIVLELMSNISKE